MNPAGSGDLSGCFLTGRTVLHTSLREGVLVGPPLRDVTSYSTGSRVSDRRRSPSKELACPLKERFHGLNNILCLLMGEVLELAVVCTLAFFLDS